MTRISRRLLVGAVAPIVAIAVSACGTNRSGAAAVVGSSRITTDDLNALVSRGLADPTAKQKIGADEPGYQRQELGQLINRRVFAAAAEAQHVTVTEGDVDKRMAEFADQLGGPANLRQQAAANGIAEPDLRPYIRDLVVKDALGDALTKDEPVDPGALKSLYAQGGAQFDQVHSAHILVKDQALAQQLLAQVKADPTTFAALAAANSIDTSNKDSGGDLGFAGRGQFVQPFEDAVFKAQPGEFVLAQTQFGFHVIHVLEHRVTTIEQATPQLRRVALKGVRDQRLQALLTSTAKRLGVKVNPRFGSYDAASGTVAPTADKVSSPAPAAGNGGSGADSGAPGGGAPDSGGAGSGSGSGGTPAPSPTRS